MYGYVFLWTRTAPSLNVVWFSCTLPFPPLLCGQWPRRAEICGGFADAVPGHVVDMPVIVLTVVQMCRKLWKRFTVAVPGRCCW